jgi:NAD+ synthase (glutamine-hydrolysing)
MSQKTEDILGPYDVHDFFLYAFLRLGASPAKMLFLANTAFAGTHSPAAIRRFLRVFLERFFAAQFKRSTLPDGPKVGSVSLSPRGDFRMPSDSRAVAWMEQID